MSDPRFELYISRMQAKKRCCSR